MAYFPMFVDLENRDVLMVGAGKTAARKTEVLLSFGALITVIAETVSPEMQSTAREKEQAVRITQRRFVPEDLETAPYALVIAATDDSAVNAAIAKRCTELRIPVNTVDDPSLCTFFFPSVVVRGDVVCGVSSGANSPMVTQYVRKVIDAELPAEIGTVNDEMGAYREEIHRQIPGDGTRRTEALRRHFGELLAAHGMAGEQKQEDRK